MIQIPLVRLLKSQNIEPTTVTGHSSGEVSAAFVAGALDVREAYATAYFRGFVTDQLLIKNLNVFGAMLVVGLGSDAVVLYLEDIEPGQVVVACHNSCLSKTLSGVVTATEESSAKFKAERANDGKG